MILWFYWEKKEIWKRNWVKGNPEISWKFAERTHTFWAWKFLILLCAFYAENSNKCWTIMKWVVFALIREWCGVCPKILIAVLRLVFISSRIMYIHIIIIIGQPVWLWFTVVFFILFFSLFFFYCILSCQVVEMICKMKCSLSHCGLFISNLFKNAQIGGQIK